MVAYAFLNPSIGDRHMRKGFGGVLENNKYFMQVTTPAVSGNEFQITALAGQ